MPAAAVFVPAQLNDLSVDVALENVARGDLLYRGASKWNNLHPSTTAGQVLASGGLGADPVWADRVKNSGDAMTGRLTINVPLGGVNSALDVVNGASNGNAATFQQTHPTASNGVLITTQTVLAGDAALQVRSDGGNRYLLIARNNGNVGFGGIVTPSHPVHAVGGIRVGALSTPNNPAVTPQGAAGSSSYSYAVVAEDRNGKRTLASTFTTISTGNGTLNGSNFNRISWTPVTGAAKYYVLKGNGSTLLGTVNAPTTQLDDTGQATTTFSAGARNDTGDLTCEGRIFGSDGLRLYRPVSSSNGVVLTSSASDDFRCFKADGTTAAALVAGSLQATPPTGTTRPLVSQAHASQSVPILEVQDSAGAALVDVAAGGALEIRRTSSTTGGRQVGQIDGAFAVATDATRLGRLTLSAADYNGLREGVRIEADGAAARLGFFGATAGAKPTVSGSRGGNAALQSLLAALAGLGLITDSTT
jgi:hypothetical protein